MNDRIDELMAQATLHGEPTKPAEFDKGYFAELIISECATVYRENVNMKCPMFPTEFSTTLRKHFGIV